MKTKIFALLLLSAVTVVFAGETDWQNFMLQSNPALSFNAQVAEKTSVVPAAQLKGLKSPKKALFMSAFIPGSGEAYAGKYLNCLFRINKIKIRFLRFGNKLLYPVLSIQGRILNGQFRNENIGSIYITKTVPGQRSEERRVGKECRSRWQPDH